MLSLKECASRLREINKTPPKSLVGCIDEISNLIDRAVDLHDGLSGNIRNDAKREALRVLIERAEEQLREACKIQNGCGATA